MNNAMSDARPSDNDDRRPSREILVPLEKQNGSPFARFYAAKRSCEPFAPDRTIPPLKTRPRPAFAHDQVVAVSLTLATAFP